MNLSARVSSGALRKSFRNYNFMFSEQKIAQLCTHLHFFDKRRGTYKTESF